MAIPKRRFIPFVPTWLLIAQTHGKGSGYIPCEKYMNLTQKNPQR